MVLTSLTKACKLKNDQIRTHLPIGRKLLDIILFEVNRKFHSQHYLRIMYKAFFALSYYGLFRVGELAKGDHQIKVKDIHMGDNKDKILIILHSSKTHGKYSRPQRVKITHNPLFGNAWNNMLFCPFKLVIQYLYMRGNYDSDQEPLFLLKDGSALMPDLVHKTLQDILYDLNLDASMYDCHSFRIGRATDMFKNNCSLLLIKQAGRWRSNAVYKYLR